ncbi:MAG: restriction endonuclease [Pyrinomonadaceae bacterium]
MTKEQFETLLDSVAAQLTEESKQNLFTTSKAFENRVREDLEQLGGEFQISVDYDPHPYIFPDIAVGEFGVEVKFTAKDTWRSVANSVFETFRNQEVIHVYVIFGKMGGVPEVKWARYDDCVIHVRTSHVPRFELEIGAKSSLFDTMKISYEDFSQLPIERKMHYIRQYAKGRLKDGERLWWLEEKAEPEHTLPIQVRLYIDLPPEEKTKLRAETTLLCPKVVAGSRVKNKYNDVAMYLLTYHGVLVSQARDLFSAGSVAHRIDQTRGGIYIQRAIEAIEDEIIAASLRMEDALFVEYWGESVPPEERIEKWLEKADNFAADWIPSETLFLSRQN